LVASVGYALSVKLLGGSEEVMWRVGLLAGLSAIVAGLVIMLGFGFHNTTIGSYSNSKPNQGTWQSLRSALGIGGLVGLVNGFVLATLVTYSTGDNTWWFAALISCWVVGGLIAGSFSGVQVQLHGTILGF
jgi:hypothetical protein